MKSELRYRQIHLDFHTSEHIENVGSDFDPDQFAGTLEEGNVDSVTLFARGHHGWAYYPSKIAAPHPNLKRPDLLGDMIEACRKRDINTPVYITVQWDERTAREHPEWRVIKAEGKRGTEDMDQFQAVWHTICLNNPEYLDYISAQALEIMDLYNPSGFFFDILTPWQCVCPKCLQSMNEKGLDPEKRQDRLMNDRDIIMNYYRRITGAVWDKDSDMRVFHNSGHVYRGERDRWEFFSHLELESLPTGGWGYSHFPISARYTATLGMEFLGMTGKFHRSWGEFGGFKTPAALEFECALMSAMGARCSIGDQLHPSGWMDPETYRIIKPAYERVEKLEEHIKGAVNESEIGLISSEAHGTYFGNYYQDRNNRHDEGAVRMLLETQTMFDILDMEADFSRYRLLILPDTVTLDETLTAKFQAYLDNGGRLILSGASGMNTECSAFTLDTGGEVKNENGTSRSPYSPDYLYLGSQAKTFDPGLLSSPFVIYDPAYTVKAADGEVIGRTRLPYFNRSWKHFCSHAHTPFRTEDNSMYDGIITKGSIIYFSHPVFLSYFRTGQPLLKYLFRGALNRLLPDRQVTVETPSSGIISLTRKKNKLQLHLLYGKPEYRGREHGVEVLEDTVPLKDVKCSIRSGTAPRNIRGVMLEQDIPFEYNKGRIDFTVPEVKIHELITLDFGE
ncbi:MAG: alpha-amylase family protein [Spirochaetia bacterium]